MNQPRTTPPKTVNLAVNQDDHAWLVEYMHDKRLRSLRDTFRSVVEQLKNHTPCRVTS